MNLIGPVQTSLAHFSLIELKGTLSLAADAESIVLLMVEDYLQSALHSAAKVVFASLFS